MSIPLPSQSQEILLQDAVERDRATARRAYLAAILWQERFLTREQLITRVEGILGRKCFGETAWKDAFYRDMRVVKQALKAAGCQLAYSRETHRPGYYLIGQPPLGEKLSRILEGSIAEVDLAQIAIFRQMTPAERFRLGCSISDTARKAVAYRIRQRRPELSLAEANRLALQQKEGI